MVETLQRAIAHHQAGQLDQAEQLYHQLLAANAGHADALHLLGVVRHQRGDHRQAAELLGRAIELNPRAAAYHSNLAEVYRAQGELQRAAEQCRVALQLEPDNVEARNNLGLVLHQLGQSDEAQALFESALQARPLWATPYVNLGNLLRDAGKPYEATAIYREGIRLCGEAPLLRTTLGALLLELGQVDEALVHCQEAVRLRPDQAEAHVNLGNVLLVLGQLGDARAHLQKAMQLEPRLALPYSQLGLILQSEGRLAEAVVFFGEAIRREPNNPKFHTQQAHLLYELDRQEEAKERYREIVAHRPDCVEAHNSLGYILQDQGQFKEAEAHYRAALQAKPDAADVHLNLGMLLAEAGDVEQATVSWKESLRHEPNHPEALSAMALTLRERLPPELVGACERVVAHPRVPGKRKAVLQYGLAQVMDARGQSARAAELARQANAFFKEEAQRLGQQYDPAEHRSYVDRIIRAYSPAHFARVHGWGINSDLPIFVLGLPRSGTSLIEQILASHPQVFGAGELNTMRDLYRDIPTVVGKQAPGIDCIGDLTQPQVRALAERYLSELRRLNDRARFIVDKMPDNYLMIGLIATLLPAARIIHVRRDERDVGLSCWMTLFKHIRWACDLEHIGHRIREYQRLMAHWRTVLPGRLLEIDYEDVVNDLEPAARRLLAWCDLPWDDSCLAFHRTKRTVRTASMTQVREPLYRRSLKRWERYRPYLGPMLRILEAKS